MATDIRPVTKRKTLIPKKYKVLILNDDYTTMDFVIFLLMVLFHHSEQEANRIMWEVHRKGVGVAGVYPLDIAETKTLEGIQLAQHHGHPLKLTIEQD